MIDKPYTITRTCPTCRGRQVVPSPHCAICQQPLAAEDDWWETGDGLLPCGHEAVQLQMEQTCEACGGNGRITQHLALPEWQAYRRRRHGRRAFVVILSLILLTVLSYFVVREPHYLCGSIWYGLITAVLLTIRHFPLTISH